MSKTTNILLILAASILTVASPVLAQVNSQNRSYATVPSRPADPPGTEVYGGYMIGVGDVLDIHVNDEDSVTGRYQVDQDGKVTVPLLTGAVPAAGATTFELGKRLSDEFKKQDILRDPAVTVLIVREMTQNVSVLGGVMRPGVYAIEKPTTLVDLISLAGGLAPNAGNILTITHNPETGGPNTVNVSAKSEQTPINITEMMSGRDPSSNLILRAGDVVTISTAPVIFVVGSVVKAGAFSVQDPKSQMTVLQALAMAEGTAPAAALSRAIIIRKSSSDSERREIPLDLKKIMRGKSKDEVLQANDILFVPQSGLKAGVKRMGDIGAQAAGTMIAYSALF